MFNSWDQDKSGAITLDELEAGIEQLVNEVVSWSTEHPSVPQSPRKYHRDRLTQGHFDASDPEMMDEWMAWLWNKCDRDRNMEARPWLIDSIPTYSEPR